MIHDLKPYSSMKDTGVPRLGEVPAHWDLVQLGRIGRLSKGIGGTKEDEAPEGIPCIRYGDLYTSHKYHIRASRAFVTEMRAQEYTPVKYGDILFAGSGETIEDIGISAVNLMETPACCGGDVILFRPDIEIDARFSGYAIDCPQSQYQKSCMGRGITIMHIYGDELKRLWITLPPLPEQTAIVRYLDHVDERIRRYVSSKRKRIRLLEEEKQAVINRAVTRGLDPNVRLKPSGVEWLGDIPAHWEVIPLRRLAISRCDGPFGSGLKSSHYTDQGIRVVRLQNIGHAEFNNSDAAFIARSHYGTLGDHTVEPEDLLVAGLGDKHHPAGRACVAPSFIVPAMVKADCFRFRLVRQRINPEFTALQLTATAVDASSLLSTGATRQRTNLQATAARPIAVPPRREQVVIVEYLEKVTTGIDAAIDRARRQIELLQEYRTRLIADVVTGQRDVRGAAAQLPEVDEWNPIGKHLLVGATYQEPSDSDTRRA